MEPSGAGGGMGAGLRLEGDLTGPWVAELRLACEGWSERGRALTLHLAEVAFVDAGGVALLAALRDRGVVLADCSPFLVEQMKALARETPHDRPGFGR